MSKASPTQLSKAKVQERLNKIGAIMDPNRVTVISGDGLSVRVFRISYQGNVIGITSLAEVAKWAANPRKYQPPHYNIITKTAG